MMVTAAPDGIVTRGFLIPVLEFGFGSLFVIRNWVGPPSTDPYGRQLTILVSALTWNAKLNTEITHIALSVQSNEFIIPPLLRKFPPL